MRIVFAAFIGTVLLATADADETQVYSWQVTEPMTVDRVEIGAVKEHSCYGERTRGEVDRVLSFSGGATLVMDEPLTSARPGSVPRATCGHSMKEAITYTQGWMDYAVSKGATRIELIEAYPMHTAADIQHFMSQLRGLSAFVLDLDLNHPRLRRTRDVMAALAGFRAITRELGLEYGVIVTGAPFTMAQQFHHRALVMALLVYGMEDPPDFVVVQSWVPEIAPEVLVRLLADVRTIWPR